MTLRQRTQWVAYLPNGCATAVLEGAYATSASSAFNQIYDTKKLRDQALDRGVTMRQMDMVEYTAGPYTCLLGECRHHLPPPLVAT